MLEIELRNLKKADKFIDELITDQQDRLGMHNLMGGAIVALQQINEECQKKGR